MAVPDREKMATQQQSFGVLVVAGLFNFLPDGSCMRGFGPQNSAGKTPRAERFPVGEIPVPGGAMEAFTDARKSMKKRAEKPPLRSASGWLSDPRCAI
jgi:hypothetical protein